jgi:hypothetical protein
MRVELEHVVQTVDRPLHVTLVQGSTREQKGAFKRWTQVPAIHVLKAVGQSVGIEEGWKDSAFYGSIVVIDSHTASNSNGTMR